MRTFGTFPSAVVSPAAEIPVKKAMATTVIVAFFTYRSSFEPGFFRALRNASVSRGPRDRLSLSIVHIIGHRVAKRLLMAASVAEDGEPTDFRGSGELAAACSGEATTGNRPAARIIGNVTTRRKGGGHGAGWKPDNRVAPGAGPVGPRVSRGDDGRRERGDGALGAAGAHFVTSEDWVVNVLFRGGVPLFAGPHAGRTGLSELPPDPSSVKDWAGEFAGWSRR